MSTPSTDVTGPGAAPDRSSTGTEETGEIEVVGAAAPAGSTAATPVPSESVEVRRNAGLAAAVGALASAVAIAYLARAVGSGSMLEWTVCVLMAAVGASYLVAFLDARTPLVVADAQGVRIRLGHSWCGMPWDEMLEIEHTPRRALRDGRLVLLPRDLEHALSGLDGAGRRQSWLAGFLHGDPFAVPLALSTTVVGADGDLTGALLRLSDGATTVVEVDPSLPDEDEDAVVVGAPVADEPSVGRTDASSDPHPGGHPDGHLDGHPDGHLDGHPDGHPDGAEPAVDADEVFDGQRPVDAPPRSISVFGPVASPTPSPLRDPVTAVRAEITRDITFGATALHLHDPEETHVSLQLPELEELRRAEVVAPFAETVVLHGRVTPIARAGESVEPIVLGEDDVEPAPDPVIGPELAAARTRIGLSVDQLADRTRIRPHVIESIEVDDFAPCGGDFYARGHLRTLARVVGIDVAPLLASYDERYADAPISPRRVFEAELATGSHGSIRGTRGGPNWSVLVAAVMALVLAWSIARLVTDNPVELDPAPTLNGSGGPNNAASLGNPVAVVLTAAGGGAHIVLRDGTGKTVFSGDLPFGGAKTLPSVVPPVKATSSDGSATLAIGTADPVAIGRTGQESQRTFVAPS